MSVRVKTIYDSGTATFLEDRLIIQPPFFGVLDGVSGLYNPVIGPRFFSGKTGGQKAVDLVHESFIRAKSSAGLKAVLKSANVMLKDFFVSQGIDINRADLLPGMTFAFAKVMADEVEILQGGDCFAAWEKTNGDVAATANQNFFDEDEKIKIFDQLIKKHGGITEKAWAEYLPLSAKLRIERANKNLPVRLTVLNGQPAGKDSWYKINLPRREIKTLILFTDGMIEFSESGKAGDMSKTIFGAYHRQGLAGMLSRIREIENKRRRTTHISQAEATALALEFK